jgi:hypothetical protein
MGIIPAFRAVCKAILGLATSFFLLGWAATLIRADENSEQSTVRATPVKAYYPLLELVKQPEKLDEFAKQAQEQGEPKKKPKEDDSKKKEKTPGKGFDAAVVSAGKTAFERSCTTCHNAARSLERTKDLAGWRATVTRMAARRGAEVAKADIEPIAVYLASRNQASSEASGDKEKTGDQEKTGDKEKTGAAAAAASVASGVSTFATISPQWRGGNDHLQNPGFAPLAWVGASWQSEIVSARVTLCISCHGVQEQAYLSRVEIVEAAARLDLSKFVDPCVKGMKAGIDAGRLVVPFGAFSAQTNPSLYRTVSTPLIFNMGQRIYNQDLGVSVLPMPYADTGINFNFDVPLCDVGTGKITLTVDSYVINGLEGSSSGIDFLQSRNLLDNNNRAAYGGRISVGDSYIRVGASYMAGSFDDRNDPSVPNGPLTYRVYGFDLQARYKRLFRCQIEYARRDNDRVGAPPTEPSVFSETVDGYYLEMEVRPWEDCCVSLVARQDFLRHSGPLAPPGSSLTTGNFDVERVTLGINIELWHQSLLMFNVEHWLTPERPNTVNVYGVRYSVTF